MSACLSGHTAANKHKSTAVAVKPLLPSTFQLSIETIRDVITLPIILELLCHSGLMHADNLLSTR